MKGISLPINAIVIVAIAVLVLVVIAAFFSGMLIPSSLEIQRESALNKACNIWRTSYNCDPDKMNEVTVAHTEPSEPSRTDPYSVEELCTLVGLIGSSYDPDDNACRAKCNCPTPVTP
jgi:hypothetical protein